MSRDHDDSDLSAAPEASHDPVEAGRAEAFAELVGGLLDGHPTPPALTPDARDLLEISTMICAAHRDADLATDRRDLLIERAFAAAAHLELPTAAPAPPTRDVSPLRRRLGRAAPWAVATVAAAAAILLLVTRPASPTARTVVIDTGALSAMHRSRATDALIGRIAPADAGRASERLDIIFDDRLTGYRDLKLRGLATARGGGKR